MNEQQKVIEKCTGCSQLLDQGNEPACVSICPAHARLFGDLDDPNSDAARYVASHKDGVRHLTDLGNGPADVFILTTADWKE